MCTLALYTRVRPEMPLLVAANRDEYLDRSTTGPRLLSADPWVIGGQDLVAGGTWLGINQHGLVVALLNRRSSGQPDPTRHSRGLLCLQALQCRTTGAVVELLGGLDAGRYNPFTLMAASREGAVVLSPQGPGIAVIDLPPGLHLLTNLEVNDAGCPRIARSRSRFAAVRPSNLTDNGSFLAPLREVLADHSPEPAGESSLCVHRGPYGTRSSSIIALDSAGAAGYWHAEGPPCSAEYEPIPLPGPPPAAAVGSGPWRDGFTPS